MACHHGCVMIRLAARVVLFAVVVGLTMVVTAQGALACSCASSPVDIQLDQADGAFIGSVITNSGDSARFAVTEWFKGRLADEVEVRSGGGECSFDLDPGDEVAMFVYVIDGDLRSSLCDTGSAARLRSLFQPSPLSTAPAAFLGTGQPLSALDAQGATVSIRLQTNDVFRGHATPCGSGRVAELGGDEVIISDIATWTDVESLPFRRFTKQLHCHEDTVLAVAGPTGERQVWDVRTQGALTDPLSSGGHTDLHVETLAYVGPQSGNLQEGVRILDLASGDDRLLHAVTVGGSGFDRVRVRGVAISPDGQRVAFPVVVGDTSQRSTELFVYSIDGELLASREFDAGRLVWLDDDRLLHTTGSGRARILDAADLSEATDLGDSHYWVAALAGDDVVIGSDNGAILRQGLDEDAPRTVNSLATIGRMVRLPEPVVMQTVGSATENQIDIPIPGPALDRLRERFGDSLAVADDESGSSLWPAVLVATAALGVVAIAARIRWLRS